MRKTLARMAAVALAVNPICLIVVATVAAIGAGVTIGTQTHIMQTIVGVIL